MAESSFGFSVSSTDALLHSLTAKEAMALSMT
jgi:hypothetical protein